mmetsp:Transcript_3558/g.11054  ORF Transcript_3558/g.11054 Transcript_3558/m.11054 type:complete len:794 (-) Transcript_3558:2-2383(-)
MLSSPATTGSTSSVYPSTSAPLNLDSEPPPLFVKFLRFLTARGANMEDLFVVAKANTAEVTSLREALQRDQEALQLTENARDPRSVGVLLLDYLRALPDPLLTAHLYDAFLLADSICSTRRQLAYLHRVFHSDLPRTHRLCCKLLLTLLGRIHSLSLPTTAQQRQQLSDSDSAVQSPSAQCSLASVFAPVLLRPHRLLPYQANDGAAAERVVAIMIAHHETLLRNDRPASPRRLTIGSGSTAPTSIELLSPSSAPLAVRSSASLSSALRLPPNILPQLVPSSALVSVSNATAAVAAPNTPPAPATVVAETQMNLSPSTSPESRAQRSDSLPRRKSRLQSVKRRSQAPGANSQFPTRPPSPPPSPGLSPVYETLPSETTVGGLESTVGMQGVPAEDVASLPPDSLLSSSSSSSSTFLATFSSSSSASASSSASSCSSATADVVDSSSVTCSRSMSDESQSISSSSSSSAASPLDSTSSIADESVIASDVVGSTADASAVIISQTPLQLTEELLQAIPLVKDQSHLIVVSRKVREASQLLDAEFKRVGVTSQMLKDAAHEQPLPDTPVDSESSQDAPFQRLLNVVTVGAHKLHTSTSYVYHHPEQNLQADILRRVCVLLSASLLDVNEPAGDSFSDSSTVKASGSAAALEVLSGGPLTSVQLHEQLNVLEARMQELSAQLPIVSKEQTIGIARMIRLHRQGLHGFMNRYSLPTPTPPESAASKSHSSEGGPVDKLAELKSMSMDSLKRVLLYIGVLRERLVSSSTSSTSSSPAEREFCVALHAELDQLSAIPYYC